MILLNVYVYSVLSMARNTIMLCMCVCGVVFSAIDAYDLVSLQIVIPMKIEFMEVVAFYQQTGSIPMVILISL